MTKLVKEGEIVDGGSLTRLATEPFVLAQASDVPVEAFTQATLPAANTLTDGTLVYVSDADPGYEFAIADVSSNTYRRVSEGGRNYFGAPPFPTDDLIFRFDANNVAGADGATITNWPDSSGLGHDADLVVGAPGPKIRRGIINGMDAVEFGTAAGANLGTLRTQDLGADYDDTAVKEFMLVFEHLNYNNTVMIEHTAGASGGQSPFGVHNGQGSNGSLQLKGVLNTDTPPVASGSFRRLEFRYDAPGDFRAYRLDGAAEVSASVELGAYTPENKEIVLGGRADASFHYYGRFAFFAGWNRFLTTDERDAARGFIETTYGIGV